MDNPDVTSDKNWHWNLLKTDSCHDANFVVTVGTDRILIQILLKFVPKIPIDH